MRRPVFLWCSATLFMTAVFTIYTKLASDDQTWATNVSQDTSRAILLWWTPFVTHEREKICKDVQCLITANRSYFEHPDLKALIFYGSSIDKDDMPPRRSESTLWGLFHEESPRNVPLLSHEATLSLFNYSATFSRASHLPLTLQFLPSLEDLISKKYFKSFDEKQKYRTTLSPVLYLQSDCSTPNNRDSYVAELMKHIPVDSYGACLNNRPLPASLKDSMETMMAEELLEMVSHYKFSIAFENAICEDYITEKLWRPLIAGSVPLYVGSPSIQDWLPNEASAIFPSDFRGPKELAEYLKFLDTNEEAYEKYLEHKLKATISNEKLIKDFVPSWPVYSLGAVDEFECLLCTKVRSSVDHSVVDISHYNCPTPRSILTGSPNESNWWYWDYVHTACEAEAFKHFVIKNRSSTEKFKYEPVGGGVNCDGFHPNK